MSEAAKSLRVVEIYNAIEGEGVMVGTPEVIVRLFGCNLSCGYCDEERSWVAGILDPDAIGAYTDPVALVRAVRAKIREGNRDEKWVSLTGGEPMFRDPALLGAFVSACHMDDLKVAVHTNGTIHHAQLMALVDFWSVTPTLSSSGNPALASGTHMNALDRIFGHFRAVLANKRNDRAELKFAVGCVEDIEEVVEIEKRLRPSLEAAEIPVVIQPVWLRTKDASMENPYGEWSLGSETMAWFRTLQEDARLVSIPRVRFIPQTHKLVYGPGAAKS